MSEDTLERDPLAWFPYGSCVSLDPDLFFPEPGADTSAARAICRECPVRRMCLDHALETNQKFGIWGGMTENQRRRLRRDRDQHPARPVRQPAASVPTQPAQSGAHTSAQTTAQTTAQTPIRHLHVVR